MKVDHLKSINFNEGLVCCLVRHVTSDVPLVVISLTSDSDIYYVATTKIFVIFSFLKIFFELHKLVK